MLRMITLLADIGALCYAIVMTFKYPPDRGGDIAAVAGIVILILLNLVYVYRTESGDESWLGLFLKRNRLEEKKKIEALEK